MQVIEGHPVYSATDLVGFLECAHLANLERAVVAGHLKRPIRADPVLDRIALRGLVHERHFLSERATEGLTIVSIPTNDTLSPLERIKSGSQDTLEAMHQGAALIYQAVFFNEKCLGYADFLRRVERPSDLGAWSYEVWDTKLARHAKASAVLQISMYSQILGDLQGRAPDEMHLALGGFKREDRLLRGATSGRFGERPSPNGLRLPPSEEAHRPRISGAPSRH